MLYEVITAVLPCRGHAVGVVAGHWIVRRRRDLSGYFEDVAGASRRDAAAQDFTSQSQSYDRSGRHVAEIAGATVTGAVSRRDGINRG